MDFFKYNTLSTFESGSAFNGWDSAMWVERYRDPGEFEIKAKLSSKLKDILPIGTLISHVDTLEIMIVENIQITEDVDLDPEITITGRSLETILDQRVIGQNWNWASPPASLAANVYDLAAANTWVQATTMINDHIRTAVTLTSSDVIQSLIGANSVSGTPATSEARVIARGPLHQRLLEVLEIDDCGIKVIRRHNFSGLPNSGANTTLLVHRGADVRDKVIFTVKGGDVDSVDYLWSIRKYKNAALVTGKFIEMMVAGTSTGLDKRVMWVDGQDIDGHLETVPTGTALTTIRNKMTVRGNAAIRKQKRISLARADLSETPTYEYRKDYNIGDLVSVHSSYGPIGSTRVIEHVRIVDETGSTSHPTLEVTD